jgi:hypothetical protein
MKEYLLKYWRKEGLLNSNPKQFSTWTEKMSFVVFNGIGYKAGDLVVLRIDDMQGNVFSSFGDWTWKAKITSIFMQEFMGYHELFFQAKYFQQLPMLAIGDRALNSDLSFMHIVKPNPIHFQGDDVQLISMLLLKFMVHPMVGRVDAINASELADIVVQSHLGEPGSCPPWPQVNDLIFSKPAEWGPSRDFPFGVVRKVTLPSHLCTYEAKEPTLEPYVDMVYLSRLQKSTMEVGKYKAPIISQPYSWSCLVKHAHNCGWAIGFSRSKGLLIEWEGIEE